jgi:predicted dehydrogenase
MNRKPTRMSGNPEIYPMPTPVTTSRRSFILQATAAGAALGFPAIVKGASPNAKINVAFIGVGGRGGGNLDAVAGFPDMVNVVALCDVDAHALDAAAAKHPGAGRYKDFRKLYDDRKDIDAVVVSTPEHTHAYATMPALRRKLPVYCEKPLTHNVAETAFVMKAAREAGVATQMGTQIHAGQNYRRVVELVQSGAIGHVRECHVSVSRSWGLQSAEDAKRYGDLVHITERPAGGTPVPDHIDWDLWLGPAPFRPFDPVYLPGPKWYRWWDFGSGTMSDLGSHWNDLAWWALKLEAPLSVEASSPYGPAHVDLAPAAMTARYEYGPRGEMPACTLHWHQGAAMKPAVWKDDPELAKWDSGVLFIGDKGMLISDYGKHKLLPENVFKDFTPPPVSIPPSPGHHRQWLDAIKNGTPTDSPFDTYAGPLTIANHLGNVAYRAGSRIQWDAKNLRADVEAAAKFLSRKPREGWVL